MDPLTAANTLATIVQLLGMFAQERKNLGSDAHQEFIEWLQHHRHEDIKNLICNTAAIQTEVVNLLRQDNAVTISKLDAINTTLATFLSRVEGFQSLSKSLLPNANLSDQAVSVLRELVNSKCRTFVFCDDPIHAFFEETSQLLTISDPIFFPDDLNILEHCGLIARQPGGSDSTQIYGITRAGAKYISSISPTVP
ncbi:MAG: hypothetical protein WCO56_20800 [Verrucomicrobiota bacterium]